MTIRLYLVKQSRKGLKSEKIKEQNNVTILRGRVINYPRIYRL